MKTKSCPYCGSEKVNIITCTNSYNNKSFKTIRCEQCHAEGPKFYLNDRMGSNVDQTVISYWNARTKEYKYSYSFVTRIIKELKSLVKIRGSKHFPAPTEYQFAVYESLKPGDVVYATMPLTKKELANIEDGHKERPYVVVDKTDNIVLTYQCTGKKYKGLKDYEYHMFKKGVYNNGKTSYIQMNELIEIPICNLKFKYNTLYLNTLKSMNKKIMMSNFHGKNFPLFDAEKVNPEEGDIIYLGESFYYVYSTYKNIMYCYGVYKKPKDDMDGFYKTGKYYIFYNEHIELNIEDRFEYADMLDSSKIGLLKQHIKVYKRRNNKLKVNNKYVIKYPRGQMFTMAGKDYLYLYHMNKNMYCLVGEDGVFENNPVKVDECWLHKGEIISYDRYISIICDVIESDNDFHHVLAEILNKESDLI